MNDNVFVFGAGASFDAGIPLLRNFVERMWEIAVRGRINGKALKPEDREIFQKAINIRDELDGYHGRAAFDDRNIEDILSLLTFNLIAGKGADRNKLALMNQAIARTIELTCNVEHSGNLGRAETTGPRVYRDFWKAFFAATQPTGNQYPAIITFNYDLVLERSLMQLLVGTEYNPWREGQDCPVKKLRLAYEYDGVDDPCFAVERAEYNGPDFKRLPGTRVETLSGDETLQAPYIPLLKLHGSVNFPPPRSRRDPGTASDGKRVAFVRPLDEPHIMPPIFNKFTSGPQTAMWKEALGQLRNTKNLIIVGYSLPRTDIYMQYFLKAALGPNLGLNKIIVFDPILYRNDRGAEDMRDRYASCFSPQLQSRIVFNPPFQNGPKGQASAGTFEHFVHTLQVDPASILFQ